MTSQLSFVSPWETEFDPLLQRDVRFRYADAGMIKGAKVLKRVKVYSMIGDKPVPAHVRTEAAKPLQGWYQDKENGKQNGRPRPCFTEASLTEPYGGTCPVKCGHCYINFGTRGYRGTNLITVPLNYGDQIAKQLSKLCSSSAGYFSSFTDPFNQLEEFYHNTQEAATAFTRVGLPVFFLSRLSYPSWAFDLLRQNPYSYAQKSINTGVAADLRRYSPGGLTLDQHLDEIRALHAQGIYVSIQVNPVVLGITSDDDIRLLFEKLSEAGADHVIVKFVEAGWGWASEFEKKMETAFPDRFPAFKAMFTENQAGGQRTIATMYRLASHDKYRAWATELGLTYGTCYEYQKNGTTGKWESIGRKYTTASQCHGQKVPMFTRPAPSLTATFKEVPECPPTGCLYCADDNNGKPRCGDETMGKATALRLVQLRRPITNGEMEK